MYEEEQLKALIDTAVDSVLSITPDGCVRLYNRASEAIFGYKADEVLGQNVSMLMPKSIAEAHDGYLGAYLTTSKATIIGKGRKVEGRRKSGEIFPMHLSVGEFSAGAEKHFVGIVRDLSNEAAAQSRMQGLQEQLELIGRHSAVSEMGAALAHELNQPLTAIDLFLAAADRQLSEDPEKARAIFQRVRDEAARAGNIVRRIREMVERTDGERTHFVLGEVIEGAIDLCRVVDRSGTAISATRVPPAVLFGQPTEIRMILVNLIKNALDATEGQKSRRVLIRSEVTDIVRVEVLDNGPGVSPEFAELLFEPFSSTKDDGLGIGLSICRTIAEGHGGRLVYRAADETENGLDGACFSLTLPLAEETGHE